MISIESQQTLLLNISRRLKKPVTAYAIGGTAMMFLGFKDATLDINIVFKNEEDRNIFADAIQAIGYRKMDSVVVYGSKDNRPEMFTLGDERLDLFVVQVIDFDFSSSMMKRAETVHQFTDNLMLKIANPHDIILMKCATDRKKDIDDAQKIINSTKIDWDILISEAKVQIMLGRHGAAFDLGEFLEKLKNTMKVDIPVQVLGALYGIVGQQMKKKNIGKG
jgi:hypothetical protein